MKGRRSHMFSALRALSYVTEQFQWQQKLNVMGGGRHEI